MIPTYIRRKTYTAFICDAYYIVACAIYNINERIFFCFNHHFFENKNDSN